MYTSKAFREPDVGANLDFVEQQGFGALDQRGRRGAGDHASSRPGGSRPRQALSAARAAWPGRTTTGAASTTDPPRWCSADRTATSAGRGETCPADISCARTSCRFDLPPASFDAVVAFYTVFHLPRERHAELFRTRECPPLAQAARMLLLCTHQRSRGPRNRGIPGGRLLWRDDVLEQLRHFDEYRDLRDPKASEFSLLEVSTTGHALPRSGRSTGRAERHPADSGGKGVSGGGGDYYIAVTVATHNRWPRFNRLIRGGLSASDGELSGTPDLVSNIDRPQERVNKARRRVATYGTIGDAKRDCTRGRRTMRI